MVQGKQPILFDAPVHQIVEQLQNDLGLTVVDLASALGTDQRTIQRWQTGQSFPQHDARQKLHELSRLRNHVRDTFQTADAARVWLRTPHRYLGCLTPTEVLRAGRLDRVEAALEALDSGIFL